MATSPPVADLKARVARLAVPRESGSPGDAATRRRLAEALERSGFTVIEQAFCFSRTLPLSIWRGGFVMLAAGFAASAAARGAGMALLALAGAAAGTACLGVLFRWDAPFRIGEHQTNSTIRTANVIGRLLGSPDDRRKVILVAHHDSKSQNLSFLTRAVAVLACAMGVVGGAVRVVSWALIGGVGGGGAGPGSLFCAVGVLGALALAGLTFSNRSPGAFDNAAALVVVGEAAQRLAADPPPTGEIIVAFTGAEEQMLVGARRLARWLRTEVLARGGLEDALVLNLDGVGAGSRLGLLGSEERTLPIQDLARRAGIPVRRMVTLPGALTDAVPLARAGLAVVTLTSGTLSPAVRSIHSPGDRVENLDSVALERATRLVEAAVRRHLDESR